MSPDDEIAGITCSQVLEVLSDYVDGDLADDVRRRVEGHVGACANCERFGGMFAEVVRGIRAAVDRPDDAADRAAFDRLHRRLDALP